MVRAAVFATVLVAVGWVVPTAGQTSAAGQGPVMAEGEGVTVTRDEVLARLNTRLAPSVLEEMILDILVQQKAVELGVAPPSRNVVIFQYGQAIRRIAAQRGYRDSNASLEDLVTAADIDGYFLDQGLTPEAFMRRIRVDVTVGAILDRIVTVSDEEIGANLDRLRPAVEVPQRRRIVVYDFQTKAAAEAFLPTLRAADYAPDPKHESLAARPPEGAKSGPVVAAAFALSAVGETAGPMEVQGKFVALRLLQTIPGNLEIANADKLTPEELAKAKADMDGRLHALVGGALRQEKIAAERGPWLEKLRRDAKVDILWHPPTEPARP